MMSDDPESESDSERGGKKGGDVPEGANPTGSEGATPSRDRAPTQTPDQRLEPDKRPQGGPGALRSQRVSPPGSPPDFAYSLRSWYG